MRRLKNATNNAIHYRNKESYLPSELNFERKLSFSSDGGASEHLGVVTNLCHAFFWPSF